MEDKMSCNMLLYKLGSHIMNAVQGYAPYWGRMEDCLKIIEWKERRHRRWRMRSGLRILLLP